MRDETKREWCVVTEEGALLFVNLTLEEATDVASNHRMLRHNSGSGALAWRFHEKEGLELATAKTECDRQHRAAARLENMRRVADALNGNH